MAIARISVKVGGAGKAGPHAAYIAREDKYANRLERGEKLEAKEAGNMPAWAQANPQSFWQAADQYERKNGATYREFEIALPRELEPAQRLELVREFVAQEIGDRYPYQLAIHTPTAADGGEQPHCHLMFSERRMDGIERDPAQHFKRYNAKCPEKGGARKENTGIAPGQRREELRALRDRWETVCNRHLERAGVDTRIDMRSHAERQSGLEPERKHLPSEWRDPMQRAQVIEFRAARAELGSARDSLRRAIPDAGAEVVDLQAERDRRAAPARGLDGVIEKMRADTKAFSESPQGMAFEAALKARKQPSTAKVKAAEPTPKPPVQEVAARPLSPIQEQPPALSKSDRLKARNEEARTHLDGLKALRAEATRLRPGPLEEAVQKAPEVIAATKKTRTLAATGSAAITQRDNAQKEIEQWCKAHPIQAKAHASGWRSAAYLVERAQVIEQADKIHLETLPRFTAAVAEQKQVMDEARERIGNEQAQALEQADALEQRARDTERASAAEVRAGWVQDFSDDDDFDGPAQSEPDMDWD